MADYGKQKQRLKNIEKRQKKAVGEIEETKTKN